MLKKRLFSVCLAVCMALTVLPLSGLTASAETTGDYTYEVLSESDKTCAIADYTGSAAELVIPSELDGYTVTRIMNYAFQNCDTLTSVTVGEGIMFIGTGAFENCTSLVRITIPDSVTHIEGNAFTGCEALTGIAIPDSVISIVSSAFWKCESLTSISVAKDNPKYSSENGVLFDKNKTELVAYPAGKSDAEYRIPESVTRIGLGAFYLCASLTGITMGDRVTDIDAYAFYRCESLTNITLPNGVTSIGFSAFFRCKSLTSVVIPDSVTSIGEWAFRDCDALTLYGCPGSCAETYAAENDIPFVILGSGAASGDVNGDGDVDAVDARWVLQAAAGIRPLEGSALAAADANGDGTVDAVDARWILQAAADIRTL